MLNRETFSFKIDTLKGSPSRPMNFDECAGKFKNCLEYSRKASLIKNADTLIELILNLEKSKDVGELFGLL